MTAFTRRPFPPAHPTPPQNVIIGDVLDLAAVATAVKGHDAVLSCLGTRPWRHVDICSRGIATIMPAMAGGTKKRG